MRGASFEYWQRLTVDAESRAEVLRGYATRVFGTPEDCTRWLNRGNSAIAGCATPVEAARTLEGFFEAMAELSRLELFKQRETLKRAQLADWAARKSPARRTAA